VPPRVRCIALHGAAVTGNPTTRSQAGKSSVTETYRSARIVRPPPVSRSPRSPVVRRSSARKRSLRRCRGMPFVLSTARLPTTPHRPSACLALSARRLGCGHPANPDLLLCLQPGTQINSFANPGRCSTRGYCDFRSSSFGLFSLRWQVTQNAGARTGLIPASGRATVRGDVWIRPPHPRG
jgi:hypothetical protein